MEASQSRKSSSAGSVTQPTEWLLKGDESLWKTYIPALDPERVEEQLTQVQGQYTNLMYEPRLRELTSQNNDTKRSFSETTYMSFGDGDTTATVTEAGQHMQISQYLDHGSSSMYAIDYEDTSEPFLMQKRTRDLQELVTNTKGFGPDFVLSPSTSTDDWSVSTSWLRNRWPMVLIREDENWQIVLQWYIKDGVVIQHFSCHNLKDDPLYLECTSNFAIRIRELDFASSCHSFNRGEEPFAEGAGPGGYGFVRIQQLPKSDTTSERTSEPDAVAAVVGLFINGRAVTKEDYEANYNDFHLPPNGIIRLAVGYKLVFLKREEGKDNWKRLVLKTDDVNTSKLLHDTIPKYPVLNGELLLGKKFFIRRNVEHILSVCMVPISDIPAKDVPTSGAVGGDPGSQVNDKTTSRSIALTCGDIYGHRICVSASFFAYKFLLDVAGSLADDHPVRLRIKEKCFGHLRWVFERARGDYSPSFSRNYYVNGRVMPDSSTLPCNGLTDTPFQILKAHEYSKRFPEFKNKIKEFLERNDHAMKWVKYLDETSKGDAFVWRHSQRAGLDYFRLDDHFWIWNTIAAISDILEWEKRGKWNKQQRGTRETDLQTENNSLMRKYNPDKVKHEILRRFTTVYDATKQRMLAVTRSPRETRFEFHSRDTALFYHIADSDMLTLKEPRWLSTLQIQKSFLVNQESDSYNPLRHGLAILMSQKGISISGLDAEKLGNDATKALTTAISSNGLFVFPVGDIVDRDNNGKHPDYLAHVLFEITFLLFHSYQSKQTPTQEDKLEKTALENDKQSGEDGIVSTSVKSGIVPFNDQIDFKNIVDVKDGWLYNPPEFLDWEIPAKEMLARQVYWLKSSRASPGQQTSGPTKTSDILSQSALYLAIENSHAPPNQFTYEAKGNPNGCQALIDIGKKRVHTQCTLSFDTIPDIWERLQKRRTAHDAKKRFIWCGNPSSDYPLMCYLASPDSEKPFVRGFFNRHANCANFFEDRTSRAYNSWTTEFHCSFLQLVRMNPPSNAQEEEGERDSPILRSFPHDILVGDDHPWLSKTSAGFQFSGDFFDRFWTCHHVESYPKLQQKEDFGNKQTLTPDVKMDDFLSKEYLENTFRDGGETVWKQRKVLELLLFFRIINKANRNGRKIVLRIQDELAKVQLKINQNTRKGRSGVNSFFATSDIFDTRAEDFFNSLATWTELDNVLEYLDGNLESILSNIKRWNSREHDRQPEKPRWTNKDERKYRDAISIALHLCQTAERGLETTKNQVTSLKRRLEKQRDEAQNRYDRDMSERSYRQSVNITYFTYSTVIFLPLGFAASIYSMQAAPPTDVLQHMVICAIVAFAVLILVMFALPRCLRILRNLGRALKPALGPTHDREASSEGRKKINGTPDADSMDEIIRKMTHESWYNEILAAIANVWDKFRGAFGNTREPPDDDSV